MLTVILPVYNAETFISEAIESILSQTYKEFYLWIVDDGSSDNSLSDANKYLSDPRVKVISHQVNRGKLAIVNEALESVETKYFTVHDADDVSLPTRFEKQLSILENSQNVMCGTSFNSVAKDGHVIGCTVQPSDLGEIRENIFHTSQFHGPTMIIQKDILSNVGGFYRIMKMGEDIDFSMRVVEKYAATNTSEVLYNYRINPESMTKTVNHDLMAKLVDRKLIYTFADQRKKLGKDSLMMKDMATIAKLKKEAESNYHLYIHEYVDEFAGYLLHYGLKKNAFLFVLKEWKKHTTNLRLFKVLLYTFRKLISN